MFVNLGLPEIASDADLHNDRSHDAHRALGYTETRRLVCFKKIALSNSLRIIINLRCQPRLEHIEIRFEITPLLKGSSVYRLPHLLGTGGPNGTLGLVIVET